MEHEHEGRMEMIAKIRGNRIEQSSKSIVVQVRLNRKENIYFTYQIKMAVLPFTTARLAQQNRWLAAQIHPNNEAIKSPAWLLGFPFPKALTISQYARRISGKKVQPPIPASFVTMIATINIPADTKRQLLMEPSDFIVFQSSDVISIWTGYPIDYLLVDGVSPRHRALTARDLARRMIIWMNEKALTSTRTI